MVSLTPISSIYRLDVWMAPHLVRGLAESLLASNELLPRAALIAEAVAASMPGAACVVYLLNEESPPSFVVKGIAGDIDLAESAVAADAKPFQMLMEERAPVLVGSAALAREDYAHLHVRRSFSALAYVPIFVDDSVKGAIEIISYGASLTAESFRALERMAQLGATGLHTASEYERERNNHLESIHRLSQLYDLEKVLNSTLDLDELLHLIPSKVRDILRADAVNLWLFDGDDLLLKGQSGLDPSVELGAIQRAGKGYVGDIAETGEPSLITAHDPRLTLRNLESGGNEQEQDGQPFAIRTAIVAPLMDKTAEVGLIEAVNREDGAEFDEDDLFFLTTVAETVASSLRNASLMFAERKVEILQTLVQVSTEITSTLRLDRVLQSVVNSPQRVIPYERCAIALDIRGRMQLSAVSGMANIPAGDVTVGRLRRLLEWLADVNLPLRVKRQEGNTIEHPEPIVRERFREYFAESGYGGFYAVPLADDQGRLGILCYESSDPDFLNYAHLEMITVLAGQTTVAVRNAQLYREVPLIGLLEPLIERKQRFLRQSRARRTLTLWGAVAAILFLVFVPLPMRIEGDAVVAANQSIRLQPEVDGVVKKIFVREGQRVRHGTLLATMDDWSYKADLASTQAKYDSAEFEMNRALAANNASEAGLARVQTEYWGAELARARERLQRLSLRSPIDGMVVTPRIESATGEFLNAGDDFAEILDLSKAVVNVSIDERDAGILRQGAPAIVKLESYPGRTWKGNVAVVSPESKLENNERIFYARVEVPNPNGELRSGMSGRSKIFTAGRPAGYVLFRHPGMWARQKLWDWTGW
jgi:RND family efflux transporter MFP subunit